MLLNRHNFRVFRPILVSIVSSYLAIFLVLLSSVANAYSGVRLKEIGRFSEIIDHELVGYGLVVGLAGTGDSSRNKATIQSIANTLTDFELNVKEKDISSRNVAAVIVTAKLPAFFEKGDRIDVKVSSMGDARSLAGGVLFMTPMRAANGETYALAQGQVTVGGYAFDSFDSVVQKNHPTVGIVSNGGLVAQTVEHQFFDNKLSLEYVLDEPDFDSVEQIIRQLETGYPQIKAKVVHAGKIKLTMPEATPDREAFRLVSEIEKLQISPDIRAKVIINERTGSVVAGGDVMLSDVTISYGTLKLVIDTQYKASQPFFVGRAPSSVESLVIPETQININEVAADVVQLNQGATIADLVKSLRSIHVTTRDIIVILQSIKRAGALHAELVVE